MKKVYRTVPEILSIIGWAIIVASIILSFFIDLGKLDRKIVSAYIIAVGIGCGLTLPKHIEDFEEADGARLTEIRGLALSFGGILLIFVGIWLLF